MAWKRPTRPRPSSWNWSRGPTLEDRIAQGAIPVDEALPIAKQIAEALEAAHEQGIIHRDLKPANVKVRSDGTVKVLDFGLAKALEPTSAMSPGMSQAPTITTPAMTQAGMILGTAAYMSPEQARGKTVDKRTDIWAFGCVLYEMLTAQRVFGGEDVTVTLARVVERDPDWTQLPGTLSPTLRTYLRRCLEKNPKQRVRDIGDVSLALEGAFETAAKATPDAVAFPPSLALWRRALPFTATAVVVGIVAGLGVWTLRPTGPRPLIRFTHVLPEGRALFRSGRQVVASSPGGEHFVYTASDGLYLRPMDTLEDRLLVATGAPIRPFVSPDGRSVGYFDLAAVQMKRVGVTGGAAGVIADAGVPYGASWGPDGTILYGQPDGIWQVSENGGEPERVIATEPGEQAFGPQRLPGGDWVLFTLTRTAGASRWDEADIIAESLTSGERRVIRSGGSDARYVPTGHLVYAHERVLYAVPFDLGRLDATGDPVPVAQDMGRAFNPAANSGAAHYAFTTNGTLLYVPDTGVANTSTALGWIDLAGQQESLDLPRGEYAHPRLSPDGEWLAFEYQEGVGADIWVYEVSGATTMRRLTEGGSNRYPVWSGDGTYVVFQSDREGDRGIFWQRADGTGPVERLTTPQAGAAHIPEDWSPTDDQLAFSALTEDGVELGLWTLADRTAERFGDVQANQPFNTVFSPDGQWMAYTQRGAGGVATYVQSVSAPETRFQVGQDEEIAHHPLWAPDGNRLFYFATVSPMAVDVRTQPTVGFGRPVPLVGLPVNTAPDTLLNHDVTPDGSRFVAVFPEGVGVEGRPREQIVVVHQNWFTELQRLVPTN